MTQATTDNLMRERLEGIAADTRDLLRLGLNIDSLAGAWLSLCAENLGQAALFYSDGTDLVGWRSMTDSDAADISSWRVPAQPSSLYGKVIHGRKPAVCAPPEFAAAANAAEARSLAGNARSICLVPLIISGKAAGMLMFGSQRQFSADAAAALQNLVDLLAARILEIYRGEAAPRPKTATIPLADEEEKKIREILRHVENLPAMPLIASKVLETAEDASVSVEDLQKLINNDPILAAKILKVANSSYYCGGMDVNTLTEAMVILGFNTLRSLVIAASMRGLYAQKPSRRVDAASARFAAHQKSLWEHSVACAAVSRAIAKKMNCENPETAFVAGLLHDIGRLVMFRELPEKTERWLAARKPAPDARQPADILASEKKIFSLDHCQVGAAVARKWRLSAELVDAISNHHGAETGLTPAPLTAIVDFANSVCLKNQIGPIALPRLNLDEQLAHSPLPLSAADAKALQDELSRVLAAEAFFL